MLCSRRSIAVLLIGLFVINSAHAISITASVDWANCQLQDSITSAGNYYASDIESTSFSTCSDATISVSGATSTTAWTVKSYLSSSIAGTGISIDLKRTGNGTGNSLPHSGETYVTQTTAPQDFFTGQGNISSIPIRFKIRNFETSDGYGTKTIQLRYEVTTN